MSSGHLLWLRPLDCCLVHNAEGTTPELLANRKVLPAHQPLAARVGRQHVVETNSLLADFEYLVYALAAEGGADPEAHP